MEIKDDDLKEVSGGFMTIVPYAGGVKSGKERLYKIEELSEKEKECLIDNGLCKVNEKGIITEITDEDKAISLLREKGFEEKKIYASVMKN